MRHVGAPPAVLTTELCS